MEDVETRLLSQNKKKKIKIDKKGHGDGGDGK